MNKAFYFLSKIQQRIFGGGKHLLTAQNQAVGGISETAEGKKTTEQKKRQKHAKNRKQSVLVFSVIALMLLSLLSGCSGGTKASDKAVSVAKQAIEIADDYLDGNITATAAIDKLDGLKEDMAYVDNLTSDDKNKAADFSISTSLTTLSSSILSDSYNSSDETYDKVVEGRNKLADKAGLKKR